jgi:hypothetical protein
VRLLEVVHELDVGVELVADGHHLAGPLQPGQGVRRLVHLALAHLPDGGEQSDLVIGAEQGQGLGVALLQSGEELVPQPAHVAAELHGLAEQDLEAVVGAGRGDVVEGAAEIDPRRCRPHQQGGIDGRLEQGQLPLHPFDVLAVSDLEQPIGDPVPVGEQLVVLGHAEVEGEGHLRGQGRAERVAVVEGRDDPVTGLEDPLHLDQAVGQIEEIRPQLAEGLRSDHRPGRVRAGAGAEQLAGQEVEQGGLVDGLDGVLAEELIAPLDQVVDVLHHHRLLVGGGAQPGQDVGLEGVLARGLGLGPHLGVLARVGIGQGLEQILDGLAGHLLGEGPHPPEAAHVPAAAVGGIEDVVVPALRLLEPLLAPETLGDEERDVEEELPVVGGVGPAQGEVHLVDGERQPHHREVGVVVGGEGQHRIASELIGAELDRAQIEPGHPEALELAEEGAGIGVVEGLELPAQLGPAGEVVQHRHRLVEDAAGI